MGSQSWKRHQPKMKIFALLSLFIFSAAQAQFFGVETGYNNTCLWEKEGLNRAGPREFDCPRFVIESTDQIWNMYRVHGGRLGEHQPDGRVPARLREARAP